MSAGRAVRRELFPDLEDAFKQEVYEIGGIVLPDGQPVELVRDGSGRLSLLDSRAKKASEAVKAAGRTYVPPSLPASILEALTLPIGRAPCGSTEDVFGKIHDLFVEYGISDQAAQLVAYYTISTWFPEMLPIAPYLVITGSRPEANIALQLLACLVRHGLPLGDINLAAFRSLPMHIQPTLLLGHLHPSMHRAMSVSTYPDAHLPCKDGLTNVYCAKVVYAGSDGLAAEPVLKINLAQWHRKLPVIQAAARQAIAADFQPRLLDYRMKYIIQVSKSEFDVPTFPSNLRILARALGACIVDAPGLQAGIAPLLEGQQEILRANRWVDPQHVALEVLLSHCHGEQASIRFGVGEIAEAVTAILADRGETAKVEAKPMGNFLRMLGFNPKRDTQGYALFLTDDLRRQIHKLARDYQIEGVKEAEKNCSQCAVYVMYVYDCKERRIQISLVVVIGQCRLPRPE